jgi:hypothetical protein
MRIHLQALVTCAALLAAVALLVVEINVPAVGIDDFGSAVRGSLGVSLEDLSLSHNLGVLSLLLNGGFALLSGAFACFVVAKHHRKPAVLSAWRPAESGPSGTVEHRAADHPA